MAVVIAALGWALVYFARDELHLNAKAPEDEIPVQSAVSSEEGFSQVQRHAGQPGGERNRVHAPCKRRAPRRRPKSTGWSSTFSRSSICAPATSPRYPTRARCGQRPPTAATEYQRLKEAVRGRPQRLGARGAGRGSATWKADQARLTATDQAVAAAHASIRASWGEVLRAGRPTRIVRVPGVGAAARGAGAD